MKTLSFIFLVFIFFACSADKSKEVFPIDIVLKNSMEQQNKLVVGNLEKYKQIDTAFVKKWFAGLHVPEQDNKELKWYLQTQWFFIDHRKIDDNIVFSILSNGEGGSLDLYYLTYNTANKKIIAINYLVGSYGDEGSYKDDLVEWTDKNSIRVTSKEVNVEELSDSLKVSKRDSFVTLVSFADKPLKSKEIFRNSKVDTIKIKVE